MGCLFSHHKSQNLHFIQSDNSYQTASKNALLLLNADRLFISNAHPNDHTY